MLRVERLEDRLVPAPLRPTPDLIPPPDDPTLMARYGGWTDDMKRTEIVRLGVEYDQLLAARADITGPSWNALATGLLIVLSPLSGGIMTYQGGLTADRLTAAMRQDTAAYWWLSDSLLPPVR